MPCNNCTPSNPSGFWKTSNSNVLSSPVPFGSQFMSGGPGCCAPNFGSATPSGGGGGTSVQGFSSASIYEPGVGFGQSNGAMSMGVCGRPAFGTSPFVSQNTSGQYRNFFEPSPTNNMFNPSLGTATPFIMGPSRAFCQGGTFGGEPVVPSPFAPKASSNIPGSSKDMSKIDASAGKESEHQQKLQSEEIEKSLQLICKDVARHQENMESWIERYRSLELEKIKHTETINQLRKELITQVTRRKDAIIAEYLESPAFAKRLEEEHEKWLSETFHPSFVKALGTAQTKLPETDTWELVSPMGKANSPLLTGSSYASKKEAFTTFV